MIFWIDAWKPLEPAIECHSNSITIRCDLLAHADRVLIKRLLIHRWKQMNWPLQSMTHASWELLCDLVSMPGSSKVSQTTWPGNVTARVQPNEVVLTRAGNPAPDPN